MDFREWLILQEMAQMLIRDEKGKPDEVMTVVGPIDSIDFRFEDYPKRTEAEKDYIRLFYTLPPSPFHGRLPGGRGKIDYVAYDGKNLQKSQNPPMGDSIELKEDLNGYSWWDYAECIYKDQVVKKPLKMRWYN